MIVLNDNFWNGPLPFGTPQQVALRCRILLAAASGQSDLAIAQQLSIHRHTVRLWRNRFLQEGLQGLWTIAPGRGPKPTYSPEKIQQVVATTLQSKPKGRTHWSCRSLAQQERISKSTVNLVVLCHEAEKRGIKLSSY